MCITQGREMRGESAWEAGGMVMDHNPGIVRVLSLIYVCTSRGGPKIIAILKIGCF